MRRLVLSAALVACASPLWAQAAQQGKDNDPTHKVAGGVTVPGWTGRIDPQAERRGMKIDDAKFAPMYAQMLVGMVGTTGQWWLDARKPPKRVVAQHLVNLAWNGLSGLEARPGLRSTNGPRT